MSDLAIRAEGLSKRYRIGGRSRGYQTLRETLMQSVSSRMRRTFRFAMGRRRTDTDQDCNRIWALKDVSFEIRRGDVVGIIGPNGAGKSTLLKVLSRISEPTKGYADVHGRTGSLLEVGTGFHPELTGRENIFLNGAILGMARREIQRKFDQIVDFAAVDRFLDTPVKHFSSGMYLRLAFAIAAHLEPDILFVDEVLAMGDISFQRKCLNRMEHVAHEGRTVLFVSHNMGVIRSLCSKGIFLDGGQIEASGELGACIARYIESTGVAGDSGRSLTARTANGFDRISLDGGPDNSIDQAEGFAIETVLRLRLESSGFDLHCVLQDMNGRVVFRVRKSSRELGINGSACGEHSLRLEFPPLWLVPGLYSLEMKAKSWGRTQSKYVSDRFPLDVTGQANTTCSSDPGYLHPHVVWSRPPRLQEPDGKPGNFSNDKLLLLKNRF